MNALLSWYVQFEICSRTGSRVGESVISCYAFIFGIVWKGQEVHMLKHKNLRYVTFGMMWIFCILISVVFEVWGKTAAYQRTGADVPAKQRTNLKFTLWSAVLPMLVAVVSLVSTGSYSQVLILLWFWFKLSYTSTFIKRFSVCFRKPWCEPTLWCASCYVVWGSQGVPRVSSQNYMIDHSDLFDTCAIRYQINRKQY